MRQKGDIMEDRYDEYTSAYEDPEAQNIPNDWHKLFSEEIMAELPSGEPEIDEKTDHELDEEVKKIDVALQSKMDDLVKSLREYEKQNGKEALENVFVEMTKNEKQEMGKFEKLGASMDTKITKAIVNGRQALDNTSARARRFGNNTKEKFCDVIDGMIEDSKKTYEKTQENAERIKEAILDPYGRLRDGTYEALHDSVRKVFNGLKVTDKKISDKILSRGIEYSDEIKKMGATVATQDKVVEKIEKDLQALKEEYAKESQQALANGMRKEDCAKINEIVNKIREKTDELNKEQKQLKQLQEDTLKRKQDFTKEFIEAKETELVDSINQETNHTFKTVTIARNAAIQRMEAGYRAMNSIKNHFKEANRNFLSVGLKAYENMQQKAIASEMAYYRADIKVLQNERDTLIKEIQNIRDEMSKNAKPLSRRAFREFLHGRDNVQKKMNKQIEKLEATVNKINADIKGRAAEYMDAKKGYVEKREYARNTIKEMKDTKTSLKDVFKIAKDQSQKFNSKNSQERKQQLQKSAPTAAR